MVIMPKIENYDINVLVALGNQTNDAFTRNRYKFLIIEKIIALNYSMFYLIDKFLGSNKILKEAYAEVIIIEMKDCDYPIADVIIDEIIQLVSLDTLVYYGADSPSLRFSSKCINEFWNRGIEIEDKYQLNKKRNMGKIRLKNIFKIKKKGDKK